LLNALQGKEVAPYTDKKTGAQISYDPTTGQWYSGYPGKPRANISADSPQAKAAAKYYAGTAAGAPGGGGAVPGGTATQKKEVAYAKKYGAGSGITYTWGGVSPITGFDCSGYLFAAYASAGVTIPRDTRSQWNDPNAIDVLPGAEQPGDGVYFSGSRTGANAGPPPGHVGIYIGGGKYIEYYSGGKPAKIADLASAGDYMGARRWLKIGASGTGKTSSPYGPDQTSGGGGGGGGTTKTKKPAAPKWVGATQANINTALGSVAATLRGLPATLDPVERNAVAHIEALKKQLVPHMTSADEANVKVALTKWGKILQKEITANAKVVAAAAAAAKQVFDRALSLDVSHILRDFDENYQAQSKAFDTATSSHLKGMQTAFSRSQAAFDKETQKGLAGFVVAQTAAEKALADFQAGSAGQSAILTPQEQALADFQSGRSAGQLAKQKADIQAQIAATQAQIDSLGSPVAGTGATGTLIDIATGVRTAIVDAAATTADDLVKQRADLTSQLADLQSSWHELELNDQETALSKAADVSRRAADKAQAALEASLQDAADASRTAQDAQTSDQQ
ncbi:MAG TPA: C40 family peptidase, partial [Burkholderiaceae bacterium]